MQVLRTRVARTAACNLGIINHFVKAFLQFNSGGNAEYLFYFFNKILKLSEANNLGALITLVKFL